MVKRGDYNEDCPSYDVCGFREPHYDESLHSIGLGIINHFLNDKHLRQEEDANNDQRVNVKDELCEEHCCVLEGLWLHWNEHNLNIFSFKNLSILPFHS